MFKKITFFVFLFANQALAVEAWNSNEGLKLLEKSQFKNDFYQLANFYQAQINPLYCSVASSVIILNALNRSNFFTQQEFLNDETDKIKSRKIINSKYDPGVRLDELSQMLSQAYNLKTTVVSLNKNNQEVVEDFRQTLKKILSDKDKFIVANFDGKILGLKTKGHISPLAAYNEEHDLVLVLDVALHKNQWFWTPLSELVAAMHTKDGNFYRGYLLVERQ